MIGFDDRAALVAAIHVILCCTHTKGAERLAAQTNFPNNWRQNFLVLLRGRFDFGNAHIAVDTAAVAVAVIAIVVIFILFLFFFVTFATTGCTRRCTAATTTSTTASRCC